MRIYIKEIPPTPLIKAYELASQQDVCRLKRYNKLPSLPKKTDVFKDVVSLSSGVELLFWVDNTNKYLIEKRRIRTALRISGELDIKTDAVGRKYVE